MKFRLTLLLLIVLIAYSCNTNKKNKDSKPTESVATKENKNFIDTITSIVPVQIGNDKGLIKIVGVRIFENKQLKSSNFLISLNEINDYSITKHINKETIIDNNKSVHLKDSTNGDYLGEAIIKNIEFDFVRSNTLYFNAALENPSKRKEIIGRFNLFYGNKKKGLIYGWFTDEIKEILHDKK